MTTRLKLTPPLIALLLAIGLFMLGGILNPGFMRPALALNIVRVAAFLGIIAAGQTLLLHVRSNTAHPGGVRWGRPQAAGWSYTRYARVGATTLGLHDHGAGRLAQQPHRHAAEHHATGSRLVPFSERLTLLVDAFPAVFDLRVQADDLLMQCMIDVGHVAEHLAFTRLAFPH